VADQERDHHALGVLEPGGEVDDDLVAHMSPPTWW
jgi:hypothetical protein